MNMEPKRLMSGQRTPRKVRNLTGSRSESGGGDWKIDSVEKDERNSEERPTSESGRERDRVGCVGKERDAVRESEIG
jgi:hypothetical protein